MSHSLGEKLRELRSSHDLSMEQLADELNDKYSTSINKGMISKWENNIGEPRLDTARVLSQFFNIKLDELLGLEQTVVQEDWTKEELGEIEKFKDYVRSKRTPKSK